MKLNWRKAIAYEERSVWLRLDWWVLKSSIFLTATSSIISSQFTKSDLKLSPLLLIQWLLEFIFVFPVVLLLSWQSCSSYSLVHGAKVPNITRPARFFHWGSCNLHWWCLFFAQSNLYSCRGFSILMEKGASVSQMHVLTYVSLQSDLWFRNRLSLWVKSCCFN